MLQAVDSSRKRRDHKQWNLKHEVPSKMGSTVWSHVQVSTRSFSFFIPFFIVS